ncbi:MAG TPA: adenine phosphoribosyltransferase [Chloroflexota bacterium]
MKLEDKIRDVPDFPIKGVLFKDITTLLKDPDAYHTAIDAMVDRFRDKEVDVVVGMESRGFVLAAPMAYLLGAGLVPVRKLGKLPAETVRAEYSLEYGTNTLEMHKDAIQPGQRVLVVDDLLATGGTTQATVKLVEQVGGKVLAIAFLIELTFLHGREKLKGYDIYAEIKY